MVHPDDLHEYPVVERIPVAWGDMDALGHVNNVQYFRYFESARIAYFTAMPVPGGFLDSAVGPILRDTSCRFRRPVTYPDTLLVGARVLEADDDHFRMSYLAYSEQQQATVAEGTGTLVGYDYENLRKAPWPDAVQQAINTLEASASPL